MSFANAPWHDDCDRIAIGPLGFTFEHPAANPAQYPGYWLSGQHLYRNGKLKGTAVRYWFDQDSLAWYADYRRLPAAAA